MISELMLHCSEEAFENKNCRRLKVEIKVRNEFQVENV